MDLEGSNGGVWLVDVYTPAAPAKAKFQASGWARVATDHNLRAGVWFAVFSPPGTMTWTDDTL